MSADQPLPHSVRAEVLNVIWAAFHYRDDLKSLMLGAGVSPAIYNRYDSPETAKVKIARAVFDELQQLGPPGWEIQHRIAAELCAMRRPANGVVDVKAGGAALDQLRRAAEAANVIVDTEKAAIGERKARAAQKQKQIHARRALLDQLSDRFAELASDKSRTPGELQARGYELEKLLVELFKVNEIDYLGSRRTAHEQVDGSFFFHGFTYLVEARWRHDKPTIGDLADFKFKVDGKIDSTRGLFISMAGFDDEVLDHFASNSGTRRNVIYMTGHDLALIFGGHIGLVDALLMKINAAESRGEYLIDLLQR
ncbi:hypothetical protein [[Mycobacterium] zoologicum]|uniref:hypothetical protein n=1 Tax=[Mycobacterium] zoologicum TaxID=2872311 RepID=UPI002C70A858|nr:hypothetical protein [Mycolicibacter sp. MYC101]MEB3065038.1 hypothetical protein [Mycolicibacter sp. MYC101]